jgi:hypothetical protein
MARRLCSSAAADLASSRLVNIALVFVPLKCRTLKSSCSHPDFQIFHNMFTARAVLSSACLLGLASIALADIPAGNLVALPTTDCSSYPEYNSTDNTAGPWIIQGDSTGNSDIDGHGDTTAYQRDYMPLNWGSVHASRNPEAGQSTNSPV